MFINNICKRLSVERLCRKGFNVIRHQINQRVGQNPVFLSIAFDADGNTTATPCPGKRNSRIATADNNA